MMAEPIPRQLEQHKYSNRAPSAFQFQPASPLETLVRRTSSKRYNQSRAAPNSNSSSDHTSDSSYNSPTQPGPKYDQRYPRSYTQSQQQQQQNTRGPSQAAPPSPLLHGHFRDTSSATGVSADDSSFMDNSFIEMDFDPKEVLKRESVDSRHSNLMKLYTSHEEERYYYDADSVYSADTALRDSWQSTSRGARISHSPNVNQAFAPTPNDVHAPLASTPPTPSTPSTPISPVPTVVVTPVEYNDPAPRNAGKTPILKAAAAVSNFSRPARSASDAYEEPDTSTSAPTDNPRPSRRHKSSAAPVLEAAVLSLDSKRKVLERNASRRQNTMSPTSSVSPSGNRSTYARTPSPLGSDPFETSSPSGRSTGSTSPLSSGRHNFAAAADTVGLSGPPSSTGSPYNLNYSGGMSSSSRLPSSASLLPSTSRSMSSSPSPSSSRPRSPYNAHPPAPINTSASLSPPSSAYQSSHSNEVLLPRKPPSLRTESPASLYSDNYSFYQLDGNSPNGSGNFKVDSPAASTRSKSPASTVEQLKPEVLSKAQECLQLGITHHEANRLREAAVCFEQSAKVDGGCGVGMLMWGLTLRHGWGCQKDEKAGFQWLRKAAEGAVTDLEKARLGAGVGKHSSGAVKAELVLAIYEVGQCFFHGWGVPKDQKMAVSYYTTAARLGDADAQNDLGFCLANGKGCKKDRKEAAKWYRAAVAQGQSDIGLAWIYKEKFQ